jgi:hypothetical protein
MKQIKTTEMLKPVHRPVARHSDILKHQPRHKRYTKPPLIILTWSHFWYTTLQRLTTVTLDLSPTALPSAITTTYVTFPRSPKPFAPCDIRRTPFISNRQNSLSARVTDAAFAFWDRRLFANFSRHFGEVESEPEATNSSILLRMVPDWSRWPVYYWQNCDIHFWKQIVSGMIYGLFRSNRSDTSDAASWGAGSIMSGWAT